jgi:AcrR family transcriptional regulator
MARTGRRPGDSGSRGRILAAAREAFASAGFDGATIRGIAGAAAVDPALVHHYFGSKERLFVAATDLPMDPEVVLPALLEGPRDELGRRLATLFLSIWDDPHGRHVLLGILRSAVSDPRAATMIRELIVERIVGPLVAALGSPDAKLRTTLVGSQLIGIALVRYIIEVEPLASAPAEAIVRAIAPTIQRYLTGPLDVA